jgi:hypothetical protein
MLQLSVGRTAVMLRLHLFFEVIYGRLSVYLFNAGCWQGGCQ